MSDKLPQTETENLSKEDRFILYVCNEAMKAEIDVKKCFATALEVWLGVLQQSNDGSERGRKNARQLMLRTTLI